MVKCGLSTLSITLFLTDVTAKGDHQFFIHFLLVSVLLEILLACGEKTHLKSKDTNVLLLWLSINSLIKKTTIGPNLIITERRRMHLCRKSFNNVKIIIHSLHHFCPFCKHYAYLSPDPLDRSDGRIGATADCQSASGLLQWEEYDVHVDGLVFLSPGSTPRHFYMVDIMLLHLKLPSFVCSSKLYPNFYICCLLHTLDMTSLFSLLPLKAALFSFQSVFLSVPIDESFVAQGSPVSAHALSVITPCLHSCMPCSVSPPLKTSASTLYQVCASVWYIIALKS